MLKIHSCDYSLLANTVISTLVVVHFIAILSKNYAYKYDETLRIINKRLAYFLGFRSECFVEDKKKTYQSGESFVVNCQYLATCTEGKLTSKLLCPLVTSIGQKNCRLVENPFKNVTKGTDCCDVSVCHTCSRGKFGDSSYCGGTCHCINQAKCHILNGSCRKAGGCAPGYYSKDLKNQNCQDKCKPGTYGRKCKLKCGKCLNDEPCDVVTGACAKGCASGYTSSRCTLKCKPGTYGSKCKSKCGKCLNDEPCDVVTGACANGCASGYALSRCNIRCSGTNWGTGCSMQCHCKNPGEPCGERNGSCFSGCADNWKGPNCQSPALTYYTINEDLAVGLGVAGGMFLILIIVVSIFLIRWSRRNRNTSKNTLDPMNVNGQRQANVPYDEYTSYVEPDDVPPDTICYEGNLYVKAEHKYEKIPSSNSDVDASLVHDKVQYEREPRKYLSFYSDSHPPNVILTGQPSTYYEPVVAAKHDGGTSPKLPPRDYLTPQNNIN